MTDMVERVARACHAAIEATLPARCHQRWEDITLLAREAMFVRARAAIEAMREPTTEMLWAYELPNIGPDEIRECWQAMIDAALS